jgi:hypothetical protein
MVIISGFQRIFILKETASLEENYVTMTDSVKNFEQD